MQTSACTQKAARFGETTCRPSFPPPFASPHQEASPGDQLSLGLVPRHGSGFSQKRQAGTPGSQPTNRRRTAAHRGLRASPPPPPATRTTPRSPGRPRVSPPLLLLLTLVAQLPQAGGGEAVLLPPVPPPHQAALQRSRHGRRPARGAGALLAGTGRGARWDAESGGCRRRGSAPR